MKYLFYVLGLVLLSLGIALTILSNLGTSPFDALLVGLAFNVGLTVGSWEVIVAAILIGFNALLKRQRPEILGIMTAVILGISIDFWLYFLSSSVTPIEYYSQMLFFGAGLLTMGIGTAVYLHTNFAPIPVDRLTLIIKELTKTNLFVSRTIIYLVFLMLAILFSGPIGIGTVLTVCLGGLILNACMPVTARTLDRVLLPKSTVMH
ncbi:YitT family protein [Planococcus sp. ISL-109]|uniref:YczE/YyaS/YitT family protein n=1 Tax=Planococcus sp. ISL-109 TaxID=2819166 RepID=UPI001BED08B4|nr:YitT family protein [Planococcus sp. ISL-109]MBT2581261.1 YitT family protein [Planococcus sp. ISL-109]